MVRWAKVTLRFVGYHKYADAPAEVEFLRHVHRHVFHVTVHVEQFHNERDVEYIMLQRALLGRLRRQFPLTYSCESMAEEIIDFLLQEHGNRRVRVEVLEDGENGALLETEPANIR